MLNFRYYPFDIVEDEEFKNLLKMLNGGYALPSRKTVSNTMIPNLYHQTYEKVQVLMRNCFAVCLTTDGWTSVKNESYMGITAHFINEDALLQSICLGCEVFDERHTILNLSTYLKNTIQEWNIEHKITAIVSDNAPNIVGAIKKCNYRHVPCFAHSINLVVQSGLKVIFEVQKKVKSIVELFKRSSHALTKLHSTQNQMGLPPLKLKQDVITRWNSTQDMFQRIILIKDAVISTMALLQSDVEQLSVQEWQIVESASEVLKIFSEITKEVSSEKYVSMSKVLIFVRVMVGTMEKFEKNTDLPNNTKLMVTTLLEKLNARFKYYEDSEVITQAALLDPRFKKLAFDGYHARKLEIAMDHLRTKVCQVTLPETENPIAESGTTTTTNDSTSLVWKMFDDKYSQNNLHLNPTTAGIIEFDKYMQEPLINRHEDPLKWWTAHKILYPRLFVIVKKRLCIPATSVPCERLFSKAGLVITERRNRMLASKSSQVLFLNQNL